MKKCENCDIEIVESYGSGRFCGQKCARSFSTKKDRKAISEKVKSKAALKREDNPNFIPELRGCINCSKEFWVSGKNKKKQKFCSRICSSNFSNKNEITKSKIREARIKSIASGNVGYGLKSSYKGIRCDSALEYAFLKQYFEKNPSCQISRFEGSIKDEGITYIPDFIIDEKILVEVKYSPPYIGETLSKKWKSYVDSIETKKRVLNNLKEKGKFDFIWVTEKDIGMSFYRKCLEEVKDQLS